MSKACLSCGTVNASNARFCGRCGKPLSSDRVSSSSRAKRGTEISRFCKKCGRQVRVKGKAKDYFEPDSPVELDLVEWEYWVLDCGHKEFIRKTGRTKNDLTGL